MISTNIIKNDGYQIVSLEIQIKYIEDRITIVLTNP